MEQAPTGIFSSLLSDPKKAELLGGLTGIVTSWRTGNAEANRLGREAAIAPYASFAKYTPDISSTIGPGIFEGMLAGNEMAQKIQEGKDISEMRKLLASKYKGKDEN